MADVLFLLYGIDPLEKYAYNYKQINTQSAAAVFFLKERSREKYACNLQTNVSEKINFICFKIC